MGVAPNPWPRFRARGVRSLLRGSRSASTERGKVVPQRGEHPESCGQRQAYRAAAPGLRQHTSVQAGDTLLGRGWHGRHGVRCENDPRLTLLGCHHLEEEQATRQPILFGRRSSLLGNAQHDDGLLLLLLDAAAGQRELQLLRCLRPIPQSHGSRALTAVTPATLTARAGQIAGKLQLDMLPPFQPGAVDGYPVEHVGTAKPLLMGGNHPREDLRHSD